MNGTGKPVSPQTGAAEAGPALAPRRLRRPRAGMAGAASLLREGTITTDPLRLAMAAFVVITISNVHMYVRPLALLRPGLLLWIFVVVYPILVPQSVRWTNMTTAWPARVFAALGILACLSIPFGLSMGASGKYFIDSFSRVLLFGVVMMVGTRNVADLRTLVWSYVASMAILIVLALTVMDVRSVVGGIARLQSHTMYDSNDLGVLFMVGLPLAMLTFATSGLKGKLFSGFVLAGIPVVVAITGSRGALVGLVGLVLAFFIGVRTVPFSRKLVIAVVAAGGISVAAPPGYWQQMETIIRPGDDYNLTSEAGRKQVAQRGFGYMMKYPMFGVGVGGFGVAEATISPLLRNMRPGDRLYVLAPHNTYVQVGAELGLGALILWIGMLAGGVVSLARLKRRLPPSWQAASADRRFLFYCTVFMPLSFIGFAIPTTFVSHAYLPSIYLLLACLAAVIVCARELQAADGGAGAPIVRTRRGRRPVPRPGAMNAHPHPG